MGRKEVFSAHGGHLIPLSFGSAGIFSFNLVMNDETGTCQTLTLWTSGLEKLAGLIGASL